MRQFNASREIESPAMLDVYGDIDERMPWRKRAECLGAGAEIFFPTITGRHADRMREESLNLAQSYCGDCEVRDDCNRHAEAVEGIGIWAGRFLT